MLLTNASFRHHQLPSLATANRRHSQQASHHLLLLARQGSRPLFTSDALASYGKLTLLGGGQSRGSPLRGEHPSHRGWQNSGAGPLHRQVRRQLTAGSTCGVAGTRREGHHRSPTRPHGAENSPRQREAKRQPRPSSLQPPSPHEAMSKGGRRDGGKRRRSGTLQWTMVGCGEWGGDSVLEYCFGLCHAGDGRMEIKRIFCGGRCWVGEGEAPFCVFCGG